MDTPAPERSAPSTGGRDEEERLYDEYAAAALSGTAITPARFLAGRTVSDDLRQRIEKLSRLRARSSRSTVGEREATDQTGPPIRELGDFVLGERLGSGGMGTVYRAEQRSLGRQVAVKLLRASLDGSTTAAARFTREAQVVARLRHPHIVNVYAIGEEQGVRYIAMELVEGRGLDALLADKERQGLRVSPRDCVAWAAKLARALHVAHTAGIVHRDVKPSNIRITPDNEPKLLDFGIARDDLSATLTLTGPLVGTPLYAAPEQVSSDGRRPDARTDVYGLGATLYECLTGRTAVDLGTVEQVITRTLLTEPQPPRRLVPSIARDLEVVVMKALEKDQNRRYESAAAFADDLEAVLEFRPIRARPPSPAARLLKWSKRQPGQAAALSTLVLVVLIAGLLELDRVRSADRERKEQARAAVVEAQTLLVDFLESDEHRLLARDISDIEFRTGSHYLSDEEEQRYRTGRERLLRAEADREQVFLAAMAALRRAERLDPDVPGCDDVRARFFLHRSFAASGRRDRRTASFYRDLALRHDELGTVKEHLSRKGTWSLSVVPSDAEVHLFRSRELAELVGGGDHRLVPTVDAEKRASLAPGTFGLRVLRAAGELEIDDLILAVDGEELSRNTIVALRRRLRDGAPSVTVHRSGTRFACVAPRGVHTRATAAPLDLSEQTRVAWTRGSLELEFEHHVAVVRRAGYLSVRLPFRMLEKRSDVTRLQLRRPNEVPIGFVYVDPELADCEGTPIWYQDTEVTAGAYLEFLNDPQTQTEMRSSAKTQFVPRRPQDGQRGGYWPRSATGEFSLPAQYAADWPVLDVSWDDACAFAAWRTRTARESGALFRFRLPTRQEWLAAGHGGSSRSFAYGDTFWPRWFSSCFSRPSASVEPVLSYPIDESPAGVFDMTGSAMEWLADWYGEGELRRFIAGGGWARADRQLCKLWGGTGMAPDLTHGEVGFRLVLEFDDRR